MADESRNGAAGLFGKPADSDPPENNSTAAGGEGGESLSESPQVDQKLNAEEQRNVQGDGAPNRAPTYGKHGWQDENHQITNPDVLAGIKDGAENQSRAARAASEATDGSDIAGLTAAQLVGDTAPETEEESVQYTSRIARLGIGRFRFEGGVLSVPSGEVEAFENLLRQVSPRTRNAIRKIERGEGVFAKPLNLGSRSTRGVDTSRAGTVAPQPSASQ